jgi:signal transduction histidine kinase
MDNLQEVIHRIRQHLFSVLLAENVLLVAAYWIGSHFLAINSLIIGAAAICVAIPVSLLVARFSSTFLIQPLRALWQVVLHLSPEEQIDVAAPQIQNLTLGRELVTNLTGQIYQMVSVAERIKASTVQQGNDLHHNFVAGNLPLPLLLLDDSETIQFVNQTAADYIGMSVADLVGKNLYMVLDMSFPSEDTFDTWLKHAKQNNATAVTTWERVRLNVRDTHPTRLFDLAAYYNRANAQKTATMLVIFDHTKQYSQDDQAVSFIALSVHELRTPLTLLRGYIEVFQEELQGKITPELSDFMDKMSASAQQLTAFVNNILNVARVDDDQLELRLKQEDWASVLQATVEAVSLRARVRGITIECSIAPDLPPVGIDRLSIAEVINNLVDNAIKYSADSKVIKVDAHLTTDGLVETTVQDFGVGIDTSIMPNLFSKFYRDHRNRAQIGGTGLGLYLSKAIISAHSGNLWVRSKVGAGSTFGFTVLPYASLAENAKKNGTDELVRGAHGWIKNHSLYRR